MKLKPFLTEDSVIPHLNSTSKSNVLDEMVVTLISHHPELNRDEVMRVLMEREDLGSTCMGDGVAIPHGRLPNLTQPLVMIGRSCAGIPYECQDELPVKIFIMLLAPASGSSQHLLLLARISAIFKDDAFRKRLLSAADSDVYSVVINADEQLG